MNANQAAILLAKCAAFDNRQPNQSTAEAWAEALDDDMTVQDGLDIIRDHYANSRDWIMPADLNARSRQIRKQRFAAHELALQQVPDSIDDPGEYRTWKVANTRAIGAGMTPDQASAAAWRAINRTPPPELPTRTTPLPQLIGRKPR